MESLVLQHVNAKILVEGDPGTDLARAVEVFHRWISGQVLPTLLIDVVDYRHVPDGPGVLLVGLEEDYSIDRTGGRWGLRYNRKAALPGSDEERVALALRSAAAACLRLESEWSGDHPLRFSRREVEIFINDRAVAPNREETWTSARPALESAIASAFRHHDFTLTREGDPRRRFGVLVTAQRPFDLAAMAGAD